MRPAHRYDHAAIGKLLGPETGSECRIEEDLEAQASWAPGHWRANRSVGYLQYSTVKIMKKYELDSEICYLA